ncbi:MAG: aminotransferase class I/II-fold pyridoxal phosphate-dependent enzyme [Oscillospiraceae bacterium]|nr:aminotransferase class I/II-fold pyridoxal phosphate-dependent enzyme [Oscillospiraceae bacterium]
MLYEKLKAHAAEGSYPMHMPGHKRNAAHLPHGLPYDIDITEIHGFDDLHAPKGTLLEIENLAARLYGSDKAFMLVNGSTAGMLAAVGASINRGDKMLMARNCHVSAYNAAALFGAMPCYLAPETDIETGISRGIDPKAVDAALVEHTETKLVAITSPTYEGVVSDIDSIADIAHRRGIPLLVDAAHGAHLGFSDRFPKSPIHSGADITVMSLHKTLPALTQSALLHVQGALVETDKIARMLSVVQTSSPSYVLMASIDSCLRLLSSCGAELFNEYVRCLDDFYAKTANMQQLKLFRGSCGATKINNHEFDMGKLVISTGGSSVTGPQLVGILREKYGIELEMAGVRYALAMTSICDTDEGFHRLADALVDIDKDFGNVQRIPASGVRAANFVHVPRQAVAPCDALNKTGSLFPLRDSIGMTSLELICAYPPGVPILAPGEIIDEIVISYISDSIASGLTLRSDSHALPSRIYATSEHL